MLVVGWWWCGGSGVVMKAVTGGARDAGWVSGVDDAT